MFLQYIKKSLNQVQVYPKVWQPKKKKRRLVMFLKKLIKKLLLNSLLLKLFVW
jgi:hypothetical protein